MSQAKWVTKPDQIDQHSITMTAIASDELLSIGTPILYKFEFVESPTGGSGGSSSEWIAKDTYIDTELETNHQYTY